MRRTPALMVQGTCSDAGKSLIVAGLCRAFTARGLAVRPFKPQNMSNNAAVTLDGGEIGRAQALQARACRTPPTREMNPVLLKPESEGSAQLVVRGVRRHSLGARDYHALKPALLAEVLASFNALSADADLLLCEGAGSPAEVNLRAGDIANMGFALATETPVVLVGDIERGGVIAQLVGTVALLEPAERALLGGHIVNKFRGDPRLFDDALPLIEARTGLPSLGVVPWFADARLLPKEDVLGLDERRGGSKDAPVHIVVPRLPRIANFDDLDPLHGEPDVRLSLLGLDEALPVDADLVILPGSKATIADLRALQASGLAADILAHRRRGGLVLGLCGGYQMLGRRIADPQGLEGAPDAITGLGLLPVETELEPAKVLRHNSGIEVASGATVRGYEIHLGTTRPEPGLAPFLQLAGRPEGAVSADGRVMGTYLHGLFAADGFRQAFLARLGAGQFARAGYEATVEGALDSLARHLETHLDLDRLLAIARRRSLR